MKMDGHFNKNGEPAISLDVGPRGIEFLVDTGFTGGLMIPEGLASDLDLTYGGALEEFYSATGEPIPVSTYPIEINWLGRRITISGRYIVAGQGTDPWRLFAKGLLSDN